MSFKALKKKLKNNQLSDTAQVFGQVLHQNIVISLIKPNKA